MKPLVIFYSRTGNTKKVAKAIVEMLNCDFEEIFDEKDRSGVLGFLIACKDASSKNGTTIKDTKIDPGLYDLAIIGTPIWAFTMATPIRTYLINNKGRFKKVAFFCTVGGSGAKRAFLAMEGLCGKNPLSLLELTTSEVVKGEYSLKVKKFIEEIRG